MTAIWKYPLEVTDYQTIQMPQNSEILCVQMQGGVPCLWAKADPLGKTEERRIRVAGTGHQIDEENLDYIGTFQMGGGSLVFHVFEAPVGPFGESDA